MESLEIEKSEVKKSRPRDTHGVEMLTCEEIAEYLGVSVPWIRKMSNFRKKNPMPYRQIGKRLWFIVSQVEQWNEERRG
jgi:excisionase family DNA binding protein